METETPTRKADVNKRRVCAALCEDVLSVDETRSEQRVIRVSTHPRNFCIHTSLAFNVLAHVGVCINT